MVNTSDAQSLRVLRQGLGDGTVNGTGISCGSDCNENFGVNTAVTLTANASTGFEIESWGGDCAATGTGAGTATGTCSVNVTDVSSVRVKFSPIITLPSLTDLTPAGIEAFLSNPANSAIDTPAEFIAALTPDFRQNWLLMVRSESLQTGIASAPRILLPSQDSRAVFTIGMIEHSSYPGSHPNAIEYMQWDEVEKNFRFHEIILGSIPALGDVVKRTPGQPDVMRFPARSRGVSPDDEKCFACHSTRNILNDAAGATPGTDGIPPGSIPHKSKPNWDTYDSWGGLLAFNRDRLYQGSVEVAAFRKLFNPWTWQDNDTARAIMEQLDLQPAGVPTNHIITRNTAGGANDGHISFSFDAGAIVTQEPKEELSPTPSQNGSSNYQFDGAPRTGGNTDYAREGERVTLHHSTFAGCLGGCSATSDEGRGVDLFDELFGVLNPVRVADEVANHRVATGSVEFDARPLALAIAQRCFSVAGGNDVTQTQSISSNPALSPAAQAALTFFNQRHAVTSFDELFDDTRLRQAYMPLRKADLQKLTLDRTIDPYAFDPNIGTPPPPPALIDGLVQTYGGDTELFNPNSGPLDSAGMLEALRAEVFRRTPSGSQADSTLMGGIYVDREVLGTAPQMALYRYFLEPLGISVDKWSIAVRGRSRTYTMADIFMGRYDNAIAGEIKPQLGLDGLGTTDTCAAVIPMVEASLAPTVLPDASGTGAMPKFTDIQRIFNKSCIECHGGLGYPPYHSYRPNPSDPNDFDRHEIELNFSENKDPAPGDRRLTRSWQHASANPTYLLNRMTDGGLLDHPYNPDEPYNLSNPNDLSDPDVLDESCPYGLMPCGGPPLSWSDIETFRRWSDGGATYSEGDPHIRTVDGTNYDLQTAGEFVLLRDEGFELQARHTPVTTAGPLGPNAYTGLSTCVSVNTAVALRSGGQRITYQPATRSDSNDDDDVQRVKPGTLVLRIDGKLVALGSEPITLASGGRIRQTSSDGGIQIEHPGGTVVVVTPGFWTHHQIWYMNINVRKTRATDGIMGNIAPGNWLPALANGTHLGVRPSDLGLRYQQLYETFADSWRVDNTTSLFDYEAGRTSASFTNQSWPAFAPNNCVAPPIAGGSPNTTPPVVIEAAEATQLCAEIDDTDRRQNCVADVTATGDANFAQTYIASAALERNVGPSDPVLGFPQDLDQDLVQPIKFTWTKSSDDAGDGIGYQLCLWTAGEIFDFNKCTAVSEPIFTEKTIQYFIIVVFLVLLLLLILYLTALRHKPRLLLLIALLLLLPAFIIATLVGRSPTLNETITSLDPNERYFWRVIAQDDQGAIVLSETRQFSVE
ncbi:hypothetical protein GCM10008927_05420 [Amylibacter ulvae]|uniref:VWFD domain-containing protein n=2 Tax=Paramylibacter ulvae TaxID=1651968 RepID=A0ABQ3CVU1_9RHOB|nr:hypothetical protein GCM10008927_05420 [Amylibacter ulvae]